ncbi:hypothetical protein [Frigoribacterium sp. SL97]|jgi:hypothetical protein|uniref:hypothetical protein n=1 Tax=Frigoribacterium sp. SL97 TaxID=2994664 RepID=UPI00226D6645|nr:hypothetical protein [Frigoribacterium sp. SL97]WAC50445.1 hypothetical protein OVA02_11240 [Frigoribacterium sp. SL97]
MTNTAPAFVESEHPRAADGAFTDKPQTSPEVGLAATAAPVTEEEVSRLYKVVEAAGLNYQEARATFDVAAAKHAAAAILAEHPTAVRLDLDESDQQGWNWFAGTIYDANGVDIGDGQDFDLVDLYSLPDETPVKVVSGPDGAISGIEDERYSWLTFDKPAFRGGSFNGHIDLRAAYAA